MSTEKISAVEYIASDSAPYIDGDWIRNVLILGRESKNPWNASRNSAGTPDGPRRKFNHVIDSTEELAKFSDKPAYMLHKPAPRADEDCIGSFHNPKPAEKGARADLLCRKLTGTEEFHPQCVALRDNVEHKRAFGGFSPTFDFMIMPDSGEVQTILGVESIDLVPQPASVKSAVEEESAGKDTEYATKDEHAELVKAHEELGNAHSALETRVKAMECAYAAMKTSGSESVQRSAPVPEPKVAATHNATNYREYVRS